MGRPFKKDCKPWDIDVHWPGDDYSSNLPLPDLRLEQFAVLISRNAPKSRAVRTAFPNASHSSASYRAHRILSDSKVQSRIAWLRRAVVGATGDPGLGDIGIASRVPDASSANVGLDADNLVHGTDNLGHDDEECPKMSKRRDAPPDDLTPHELRSIIARGARDGVPAAIQAAIKMLDAQLAAPEAVADPAGVCAILFNGGGGGETLAVVIDRLVQVYGLQQVMDTMSHNHTYVAFNQSTAQAQQEQNTQDNAAQADTAQAGPAGAGEGGEPAPAQDV